MIVVDSSVWIDFLNGHPTPEVDQLHDLLGSEPFLIGDLILLEVLQGVRSEAEAARVEAALRRFDIHSMLDPKLAILAAMHYRRLRNFGATVRKTVDLIIGTFCIASGSALLTRRARLSADGPPPGPQAGLSEGWRSYAGSDKPEVATSECRTRGPQRS